MTKLLLILSLTLGLAGCSGGFGTMDRIMTSWQGSTLDEVIAQWGYPDREQIIAGKKVYHWDRVDTYSMPSSTYGTATVVGKTAYVNTTTTGGRTISGSCRRTIVVDINDRVVSTDWKGNNCPFMDVGMGYQYWEKS